MSIESCPDWATPIPPWDEAPDEWQDARALARASAGICSCDDEVGHVLRYLERQGHDIRDAETGHIDWVEVRWAVVAEGAETLEDLARQLLHRAALEEYQHQQDQRALRQARAVSCARNRARSQCE